MEVAAVVVVKAATVLFLVQAAAAALPVHLEPASSVAGSVAEAMVDRLCSAFGTMTTEVPVLHEPL